MGIFSNSLKKTASAFSEIIPKKQISLPKDLLEEALIEADLSYEFLEALLETLPSKVLKDRLYNELIRFFDKEPTFLKQDLTKPQSQLIIGVNGAGKTTSIAKLAHFYKQKGENVLLVAADTFRAGAVEQLNLWAKRLDLEIVSSNQGADSASVCFDGINKAKAKNFDRVIIDTAGRLQNKTNLLKELEKIMRICAKADPNAPTQKLLVIDATQGNMASLQASIFKEHFGIDGIILTKLDGSSKAGAVFSIVKDLDLPILFVGLGEKHTDLVEFSPKDFVNDFVSLIYGD